MWGKKFHRKNIAPDQLLDYAKQRGLICSLDSSLKKLTSNRHFHFKKEKQKGVLEVTLLANEIVLNVHQNRQGDWIGDEISAWEKSFLI